jgi:hypothetical protein
MNNNTLCEGESLIMESTDSTLALTNFRILHEIKTSSETSHTSIPIKQVSSCSVSTQSKTTLLWLSAICILIVVFSPVDQVRIGSFVIAIGLAISYLMTRSGAIKISASSGESIIAPTKGMQHEQIMRFIKAIQEQISK